jgi:hypothetical protein
MAGAAILSSCQYAQWGNDQTVRVILASPVRLIREPGMGGPLRSRKNIAVVDGFGLDRAGMARIRRAAARCRADRFEPDQTRCPAAQLIKMAVRAPSSWPLG